METEKIEKKTTYSFLLWGICLHSFLLETVSCSLGTGPSLDSRPLQFLSSALEGEENGNAGKEQESTKMHVVREDGNRQPRDWS